MNACSRGSGLYMCAEEIAGESHFPPPATPEPNNESALLHMHTTMLSAALRVLARSAAIQRGEAGTAAATATTHPPLSRAAALDRLIDAAPHLPPPPAPGTHPADKGHGIPLPLSLKAGHRGPVRYVQPEPRPTPNAGPSTSARPAKPVRPANTMEPANTVDADKPPQPVPPIVQELDAGAGIKNHRVEPLITLPEDEEVCCTIRILA